MGKTPMTRPVFVLSCIHKHAEPAEVGRLHHVCDYVERRLHKRSSARWGSQSWSAQTYSGPRWCPPSVASEAKSVLASQIHRDSLSGLGERFDVD